MIQHGKQREPYVTLRDVLTAGAKDLVQRACGMLRGTVHPDVPSQEEFWALKAIDMEVSEVTLIPGSLSFIESECELIENPLPSCIYTAIGNSVAC